MLLRRTMDTPRMQAAKAGIKFYDGKPCRRCSATKRDTISGSCVACQRTKTRRRRDAIRALLAKEPEGAQQ